MVADATAITIQVHIVAFTNLLCQTPIDDISVSVDYLFLTLCKQDIFISQKKKKKSEVMVSHFYSLTAQGK